MRKLLLGLLLSLVVSSASAQGNPQCPTRPTADSTNACASTAFVHAVTALAAILPQNQIFIGNASNLAAAQAVIGDCSLVANGTITCTGSRGIAWPNLPATGGVSQFLRQNSLGGAVDVIRPVCADLSNAVASCSTDTTNASNISSGTLNTARLPSPFTSGTRSGNTSDFVTTTGSLPTGNCAKFDVNGNVIDSGGACGTGAGNPTITRQSILVGAVGTYGDPAFAVGSGLNVNLIATNTPLTMSLAAGYNTGGPIDYLAQIAADTASYWPTLPINQYSFLAVDRNSGTGTLASSQTLMRPQYGPVFYNSRQALLHFENNINDDWGNQWSSSGATFSNTTVKFGTYSVCLNGSSSFVQTTNIVGPGVGNWTVDVWANLNSNVSANIFSIGNAFGIFTATNASGKPLLYLSSTGISWDIANGLAGATTVTASAWHHWEISFDGANYRLFLDGVVQVTVGSTAITWQEGAAFAVGAQVGLASTTVGCFDEADFVPYARNVAAFTPPVAAYTLSGDWFDSNAMVMKSAIAAGPTWLPIQRIYVAEAVTNASAVSAIYNYGSNNGYGGADFAFNPSSSRVKNGRTVTYQSAPQLLTQVSSINFPTIVVAGPALVPPDAKYFTIQAVIFRGWLKDSFSAPNHVSNQDCTLNARVPVGPIANSGVLGTAYSNFSNTWGAAGASIAFTSGVAMTEYAGASRKFPVINGVAAFEIIMSGNTCDLGGGVVAQVWAVLTDFEY